jgi:hypothetical protein
MDEIIIAYHPRNAEAHKETEQNLVDLYIKWFLGIRVLRDQATRTLTRCVPNLALLLMVKRHWYQ